MSLSEKNLKPTESELEILILLWKFGPSTVRFVNDKLNEKKPVGYTTTLKFLQIMNEKGLVERSADSRTHVYKAALREEDVQSQMLDKLLANVFGGSAKKLVMQALGNHDASPEELKEIRDLIKKLEGGKHESRR
jgi:BlaI family penicillinase repressor